MALIPIPDRKLVPELPDRNLVPVMKPNPPFHPEKWGNGGSVEFIPGSIITTDHTNPYRDPGQSWWPDPVVIQAPPSEKILSDEMVLQLKLRSLPGETLEEVIGRLLKLAEIIREELEEHQTGAVPL